MLKIIKEKELENSLESSSSSSDLSESLSDSLIDKAEIKKQKTEKKVVLTKEQSLRKIETKNLKGWIYGSEDHEQWTQVLYKKKYPFQNPLRQTYRQKRVLAEFLQLPESSIHTVVYFVGDCTFKTAMPGNVLRKGLRSYIKRFRNKRLSADTLSRIAAVLEQHINASTLTTRDHVRSLKARHAAKSVCPKCGSELVVRTAKKGPNAGSQFVGCSGYPSCRFTRKV